MITKLKNTLKNITKSLESENLEHLNIGLLTGKSGIALFYYYYSKFIKEEVYAKKARNLIIDVLNSINKGYNFHTFCDGIGGLAWAMEHLTQNNFMKKEDVLFLDDLDEFIYRKMMYDIKNGNFDFLHGAIGNGVYLINRVYKKQCINYIKELVDELEKQSIKNKDGSIKWNTIIDFEKEIQGCDLGLAHGMSSVIVFLSKVFIKDIYNEKTIMLLNGAVNYLLKQQLDISKVSSNFPVHVLSDGKPIMGRRIAWCTSSR